jgi:hypothetical protein
MSSWNEFKSKMKGKEQLSALYKKQKSSGKKPKMAKSGHKTFEIGSQWLPISRTGNKFPQTFWY